MSLPLVVFDLDGTLVDTAPDLIGTLDDIFAEQGIPPVPPDQARNLIGAGVKPLLERGLAAQGRRLAADEIDRLYDDYVERYAARITRLSRPFPNLHPALDALSAAGCRLAVCTNKVESLSIKLLRELDLLNRFVTVAGSDTFGIRKPDPNHLWKTIEAAGGTRQRTVFVGDSRTDLATARAADIPVVLVSFGYPEISLAELQPDIMIDDYAMLPEAIARLMRHSA